MEEKLIDRIGDEYLNPNFQDGQILLNSDVNEIVSIVKEGINANFNDIQKIQNGSHQVGNSKQLDGADLSRFSDGEMVGSDKLIPTSQQVKSYVDSKVQEIKDTTEVGKLVEDLNELSINVENKVDKEDLVNEETTGTDKAYNCDYINELFENGVGDSLPIGTIVEYTGETIPDGFEEVVEPQDATVYIGPTEPTDGQDVWIQKGKNLFDKSKVLRGYELVSNEVGIQVNDEWYVSDYIQVIPGVTYFLSGKTSGTNNIFYDVNKKKMDGIGAATGALLVPDGVKYMRFNGRLTEIDTVQLELGNEQSSYEPYVEKKIYTKNDNGVYEEFYNETNLENYSLGEQRVGTWVDGKPLYRKVLNFGSATANTYKPIWSYADANIDKFIKFEGITQNDSSKVIMPLVHAYDENNWNCTIYASTEEKKIFVVPRGTDISSGCAIVEYTKTTD